MFKYLDIFKFSILYCKVMKTIIYFSVVIFIMSAENVKADEKDTKSSYDYEFMISEYLETLNYYEKLETQTMNKVIIYNSDGNVTRQIEITEDIEISTPAILKPIINTSDFLTCINGVSYYICNKN